jgi:hypothetical protein
VPYSKFFEGRPISNAIDVLAGGLACFKLAKGQPREAVLYATNIGRDTDCRAYVAGGLAGALRGIQAWPKEWVDLVEKAVATDPDTVDKRTARQVAEGLYQVCLNEMRKVKSQTAELESLLLVYVAKLLKINGFGRERRRVAPLACFIYKYEANIA